MDYYFLDYKSLIKDQVFVLELSLEKLFFTRFLTFSTQSKRTQALHEPPSNSLL